VNSFAQTGAFTNNCIKKCGNFHKRIFGERQQNFANFYVFLVALFRCYRKSICIKRPKM